MGDPRLWQPPAWVPPVLCIFIVATMLVWNPNGWMHPLIDYGRELYVPWRITAGEVLYRDLAYFNGPLSPYLNAFWFTLFGVNLHVLTAMNALIVLGASALIYKLLVAISDRLAATLGVVTFLTLFAFQHLDTLGNYNWLAPYSHEVTHGLTLGLVTIWLTGTFVTSDRRRWLAWAGVSLGGVFLTKPEVFAATALAVGTAIVAKAVAQPGGRRCQRAAIDTGIVVAAGLILPAIALALLASAMPASDALRGTCGGWLYVLNAELTGLRFYALTRGTAVPIESLQIILQGLGYYLLAILPMLGWAYLAKARPPRRTTAILAAAIFGLAPLAISELYQPILWESAFRPLLIFTLAILAGFAVRFARLRDRPAIQGLVMGTLALGLLPKILLYVSINHYGFGLAVPSACLSVAALTCWVPRFVSRRGWQGGIVRWAGVGLLAFIMASLLTVAGGRFAEKITQGSSDETIRCYNTRYAEIAREAINWILANTKPQETVAVLPEGISINYFTRRINPTRHINFMPPEVIMFGDERILADVQAHPPDLLLLIHRSTREYGLPLFGTDYASKLMSWVAENYRPVVKFGEEPPNSQDKLLGGMWILRRRS